MAKLVGEKEAVVTKYQPWNHTVHARMAFSQKGGRDCTAAAAVQLAGHELSGFCPDK